MTEPVALGFLGLAVPRGTHVCTFCGGSPGRDEIVLPFLSAGIRAGDKCLCILDSLMPSDLLSRLADQVDVGPPVATGQLELVGPGEAYLLMHASRTHPMVIVDGMVHDNPYYIEPSKFLAGRR